VERASVRSLNQVDDLQLLMPISIDRFVELRPFLYHVTARENRAALVRERSIWPAAELMRRAGRSDLLRWRRPDSVSLRIGSEQIVIKDQRPLVEANLSLDGSWGLADFVEYLNQHVFFWPGRADGPIAHGQRLLDRYDASSPLVLRIPTADLLRVNRDCEPLFCPFNSGAPRQNQGKRARRGPQLFTPAARFTRRESEVIELAFRGGVVLPGSTEVHTSSGWDRLAATAQLAG
jgi:hypothetical protein